MKDAIIFYCCHVKRNASRYAAAYRDAVLIVE